MQSEEPDVRPEPTEEQAAALENSSLILTKSFCSFMLQGVTGSGKTEVYLRAIEEVLARRTAMVLVPEIALTPQLGAFSRPFWRKSSNLSLWTHPGRKTTNGSGLSNGETVIGLGARSALFLPLKDIGIIIVDEEHETSFKQDETPLQRSGLGGFGHKEQAIVVLGSATQALKLAPMPIKVVTKV